MSKPERVPEAVVEREVLLRIGRVPDLFITRNEVGLLYKPTIQASLRGALAPWGPDAVRAALDAIMKHRMMVGLGVGSPDLCGALGGRAGGLEVKALDGEVSEDQARWHRAARRKGIFVAVVRSADEAEAAVERWRRGESE